MTSGIPSQELESICRCSGFVWAAKSTGSMRFMGFIGLR